MRFVKNLIAAAALATTVLDGVVGAPAGNTHPTIVDPFNPFPPPASEVSSKKSTTAFGGVVGAPVGNVHPTIIEPSISFDPPAAMVSSETSTTTTYHRGGGLPHFTHTPGSSLSFPVGGLSTRSVGAPSASLPIEGDPARPTGTLSLESMPITTVSPTDIPTVSHHKSHEVSDSQTSSNPISVTERDGSLDTRQRTDKMPGLAVDTTDVVEERQALPTSLTGRQLLPTSITARQLLPTSITEGVSQETKWVDPPVSADPIEDVDERQVVGPTSKPPRDVTHILADTPFSPHTNLNGIEHQVLPTSINALDKSGPADVPHPPIGGGWAPHPNPYVDERQALPTSVNAPGEAIISFPVGGGSHPFKTNVDERQVLPTSITTESTTTEVTELAGTCVGGCAVTHRELPADTEAAAGHVEFAQANENVVSTVTATDMHTTFVDPPITVTSTQLVTVTVPRTSDNCTSPTSTASWSSGTVTTLAPTITVTSTAIWSNGTTVTLPPTVTETISEGSMTFPPINGTVTLTRRSSSSAATTSSSTETSTSSSASSTASATTITTLTDGCDHETCGPTTQTITSTLEPIPSSLPMSVTAFPTSTGGKATSIDNCTLTDSSTSTSTLTTSTSTSTSSSTLTSSSSSAEETSLTTVTTHSTLTLTNTPDAGPPRLTPPPIARRDDGPPEAGPIDARPHVTSTTTEEIPKPSSPIGTPILGLPFHASLSLGLPWDGGRPHGPTSAAGGNGTNTGPWASTTTLTSAAGGLNPTPSSWKSTFTGPWASTTTLVTSVITAPVGPPGMEG